MHSPMIIRQLLRWSREKAGRQIGGGGWLEAVANWSHMRADAKDSLAQSCNAQDSNNRL